MLFISETPVPFNMPDADEAFTRTQKGQRDRSSRIVYNLVCVDEARWVKLSSCSQITTESSDPMTKAKTTIRQPFGKIDGEQRFQHWILLTAELPLSSTTNQQ